MLFLNLISFSAAFLIESLTDRDSCSPEFEIVNEDNPLQLCVESGCNNGTCTDDLDSLNLVAAVGQQVVDEYLSACSCPKSNPKAYGQFCLCFKYEMKEDDESSEIVHRSLKEMQNKNLGWQGNGIF